MSGLGSATNLFGLRDARRRERRLPLFAFRPSACIADSGPEQGLRAKGAFGVRGDDHHATLSPFGQHDRGRATDRDDLAGLGRRGVFVAGVGGVVPTSQENRDPDARVRLGGVADSSFRIGPP